MGSTVRRNGLSALCLFGLALAPACALAQAPAKEPFPFDWLRHDAAPGNRAAGSTFYPPVESLDAQKQRQQVEPSMQEAPTMAASEPEPLRTPVEPPQADAAPTPVARPSLSAKPKPATPMEQIEVVNSRSVTLNELKLVSLKDSRKPFIVRPSLKPGQTLTLEIPRDWGCQFLVWTQFSEEPSEQHDGVDLCGDRKINLVN